MQIKLRSIAVAREAHPNVCDEGQVIAGHLIA